MTSPSFGVSDAHLRALTRCPTQIHQASSSAVSRVRILTARAWLTNMPSSRSTSVTPLIAIRIWVRSITFKGFAERGQLNLNNNTTTPRWNNLDCDCDLIAVISF